jgi:hypothetical protein
MDVDVGLQEVSFLIGKIRAANKLELELKTDPENENLQFRLDVVAASIKERIEKFLDPEEFNSMPLNYEVDVFLGCLI